MSEWPSAGVFADLDRKEAALQRNLQSCVDEGDERKSTINALTASNEAAWEIGTFSEEKKEDSHYTYGLIVRARRDAMTAALNSKDILDRMERTTKPSGVSTADRSQAANAIIIGLLVAVLVTLWVK